MKKINYLLIGMALTAISCKKEHEIVPPPAPDASALALFIDNNVEEATQTFTVDAGTSHVIEGTKGTKLLLSANNLRDADGNLVTGNVDVELIEIDKKSEMIMMNKATVGVQSNGDHATLVSDGEFFVRITQYDAELTLISPMTLGAEVDEYDSGMRKFVNISTDEDLLWEMAEDSIIETVDDSGVVVGYFQIYPNEWGWSNIDRFYHDPRDKTTAFVQLPEGFNETNTEVYVSFDGEPRTLSQFRIWIDGKFTEHYGLFPIGLEVHFIAVAIVDGNLNYSIQAATITADHLQNIDAFSEISEEALADLIDALP